MLRRAEKHLFTCVMSLILTAPLGCSDFPDEVTESLKEIKDRSIARKQRTQNWN